MPADLLNIGLAFIEGFLLILSPCILPILPIILSASLTGSKSRPFGIVAGFIMTFTVVTLFSRAIIQLAQINADTLRYMSFIILLILGIIMVSKTLTEKFTLWTQGLANVGSSLPTQNSFWGGILFGGLVGIIWTPCAGPILAAVIVQVVLQHTTLTSILVVIAFAIGAGVPMLLIALFGRKIVSSIGFLRERSTLLRQLLGLIIILTVIYLMVFPTSLFSSGPNSSVNTRPTALINGIEFPYKAPEISGIDAWINSPPLNWSDLKGKVVLIDFWTYSCINCIRTLPYLKDWYAKYHDQGFEIIGVHSPEFQFERDINNVRQAVMKDEILYPVALDNQFVTWRNFKNEYWPAHYLVNKQGEVVYVHFGEGEYDVTENNIRFLLGMGGTNTNNKSEQESYFTNQTPETYLGYKRAQRFSSPQEMQKDMSASYSYPANLSANQWALKGEWIIAADKIVSVNPGAAIKLHFDAKKVYMVMGVAKKKFVTAKLLLNDQPLTNNHGSDVVNSQVTVNHNQLYSVINMTNGDEGTLEIIAGSPGLEVYTFTFGS